MYGTPSPLTVSLIPCKVVQAVIIKLMAKTVSVTLIFYLLKINYLTISKLIANTMIYCLNSWNYGDIDAASCQ